MPLLHYAEIPPPASLSDYVDCCWSIFVDPAGPGLPVHWVLPDGCLSFAVRLDLPRMHVNIRPPAAQPLQAPCTPGERFIGVRFRPGAHHSIDLDGAARRLNGRVATGGHAEAHHLLSEALAHEILGPCDDRLRTVVDLVRNSGGSIAVHHAADCIGLSERQFERLCRNGLGLRPKLFARIVRLQRAVRSIALRRGLNLADIAAECGYADQAHLGRDFVDLGRLRPSRYLELSKSLQLWLGQEPAGMSDLF